MSVIHDYECSVHGVFECTHPICPEIGCEGEVKLVFLKPPSIGSEGLKRFNAGIKKSVDSMKLGNLRSARAGETAYGNQGSGMLWGDDVQKVLGVSMDQLRASAAQPLKVTHRDGHTEQVDKSVMRELAGEGMTGRRLPQPAELVGHRADREKPKAL